MRRYIKESIVFGSYKLIRCFNAKIPRLVAIITVFFLMGFPNISCYGNGEKKPHFDITIIDGNPKFTIIDGDKFFELVFMGQKIVGSPQGLEYSLLNMRRQLKEQGIPFMPVSIFLHIHPDEIYPDEEDAKKKVQLYGMSPERSEAISANLFPQTPLMISGGIVERKNVAKVRENLQKNDSSKQLGHDEFSKLVIKVLKDLSKKYNYDCGFTNWKLTDENIDKLIEAKLVGSRLDDDQLTTADKRKMLKESDLVTNKYIRVSEIDLENFDKYAKVLNLGKTRKKGDGYAYQVEPKYWDIDIELEPTDYVYAHFPQDSNIPQQSDESFVHACLDAAKSGLLDDPPHGPLLTRSGEKAKDMGSKHFAYGALTILDPDTITSIQWPNEKKQLKQHGGVVFIETINPHKLRNPILLQLFGNGKGTQKSKEQEEKLKEGLKNLKSKITPPWNSIDTTVNF